MSNTPLRDDLEALVISLKDRAKSSQKRYYDSQNDTPESLLELGLWGTLSGIACEIQLIIDRDKLRGT